MKEEKRMPRSVGKKFIRNSAESRHSARRQAARGDRAPTILSAIAESEEEESSRAETARFMNRRMRRFEGKVFIGENGLRVSATRFFEEGRRLGVRLPWNWRESAGAWGPVKHWTSGVLTRDTPGKWVEAGNASTIIREEARELGWLKAAEKFPLLLAVLRKTQNGKGSESPYSTGDILSGLMKMSPGRANRRLWAVRHRANAVLSAYEGQPRVSLFAIGYAVAKIPHATGKAAILAVAFSRGAGFGIKSYQSARDWLVAHRAAAYPVRDTTDGVACRLSATAELSKFGVQVFPALIAGKKSPRHVRQGWFVRKGERTFHFVEEWNPTAVDAVREAIRAWQKQDCLAAKNREVVSFLTGEETGACPLIVREDSYLAGNCQPGTEAFIASVGWAGRAFVPGIALLPHLEDPRVLRVIQAARESRAA